MYKNREINSVLLREIEVLLSEKRTYYSLLRTGLAVITVPLTIIVFLIATSSRHHIFEEFALAILIVGVLFVLSAAGAVTVYRARQKIKKISQLIKTIEKKDKRIDEIII